MRSIRSSRARAVRPRALCTILLATSAACGGASSDAAGAAPAPPGAPPASVAATEIDGVYDVRCGCDIEAIGRCGNYALVAGQPVPLTGEIGLGEMEFCGQRGLRAHVEGRLEGGVLVATSFELAE
jgi:hypothetical protein